MVIKIPQLQNFPTSITEEVLEETGCMSVPDWEIFVQRRDDIAWSVVLSYLTSTNYRDQNDFAKRLKQLTGSSKHLKLVKKAIESFNPFKNRYSCFYNETLKQVVKEFKINFKWNHFPRVSDKLEIVSDTLRCPVVYMWKDENNTKKRIYSKHANQAQGIIILHSHDFVSEENENVVTVYNFLLNHELGVKMKNAALIYFLKEAKMSRREIHKIESIVKKGKHFLISLLTRGCQEFIPKLYKSAYVVSKLNEAGYETDPRTRDDDDRLSALFHALVLGDVKTLNVLYFFAANNCVHSECSYRNPDCSILNNLHEIENILKDDLTKVERDPNYSKFKNTADDLLGLNKFLIEVHSKLIKTKNKLNYYESTDETVFEACKRRDIIVSVLDTYQEFFNPTQNKGKKLSPLDEYIQFKNYYSLIDMTTAIIFFDNIFLLKERLVLDDKSQYSEIESSLLFSVISHVVFESKDFLNMLETVHLIKDTNNLYVFPVICRLQNKNKIEEFSKILRDTVINEDNVVRLIPRSEIKSILNSHPVFKDSIDLTRLKGYMNTAVNTKVTDIKSVLVIERALQVIGEYVLLDDNSDYSFRRFLSLVLPKEVSRILRRTRHELSHLKSYVFKPKFDCENNFSLFRSIQEEIRQIQFYFKPVFQTQNLNKLLFLIKMIQKHLEQIRKQPLLCTSLPLHSQYDHLTLCIILNYFRPLFLRQYASAVKEMLETVLRYVENDILREINSSDDWENLKKKILYSLWPLKWMVEMLNECGKADTVLNHFKLLEDFNQDTDSIDDLKNKTNKVLAECKHLLSLPEFSQNISRKRIFQNISRKGISQNISRKGIYQNISRKGISQNISQKEISQNISQKETMTGINLKSIDHFLKILKGFVYLSDEERNEIRQEIPETIKRSVYFKEKLIKSIKDGFTLEIEEITSELNVSYLSNKKKNSVLKLYQDKSTKALDLLETPDPILELEEIFSKNYADKKKYESLCKTMQFSEQSKKSLKRLVAGQNKKIPGNNLYNLHNRVLLLKKILIEENGKLHNLWQKIKRPTSRIHVINTIVWYYVRDHQLQAAVEMLLFDCMSVYENERCVANPWIKSSKLYCGINLRNVISHGSPLLECICELLDPEDLPSDMIQKILQLIESEDSIKAILELYEQVDNDYPKLLSVINSEEDDQYIDIKKRIMQCDAWKDYAKLLPYKPTEHKLCKKSDSLNSQTSHTTTDNDE